MSKRKDCLKAHPYGKCIIHTGDYRMHGRLGNKLFAQVETYLKDKKVDILITEGTMMERQNEYVGRYH